MDKKNEYKENNFKHYQSKMLLEGDLNTKFYHTIVNNIKKKKKINLFFRNKSSDSI
jgi:hypothetical protein